MESHNNKTHRMWMLHKTAKRKCHARLTSAEEFDIRDISSHYHALLTLAGVCCEHPLEAYHAYRKYLDSPQNVSLSGSSRRELFRCQRAALYAILQDHHGSWWTPDVVRFPLKGALYVFKQERSRVICGDCNQTLSEEENRKSHWVYQCHECRRVSCCMIAADDHPRWNYDPETRLWVCVECTTRILAERYDLVKLDDGRWVSRDYK